MKDSALRYIDQLLERYPALSVCENSIENAVNALIACYRQNGKLLICGNGGSAADSQHIVGELMKGFVLPRRLDSFITDKLKSICPDEAEYLMAHLQGALPALSLASENALSTAYANDAAPELCFAQQVLGHGRKGDVLLGISTSGGSANVLYAAHVAHAKGMLVLALCGRSGGKLASIADIAILAPADATYQIQEYHLPIYHTLCLAIEEELFGL